MDGVKPEVRYAEKWRRGHRLCPRRRRPCRSRLRRAVRQSGGRLDHFFCAVPAQAGDVCAGRDHRSAGNRPLRPSLERRSACVGGSRGRCHGGARRSGHGARSAVWILRRRCALCDVRCGASRARVGLHLPCDGSPWHGCPGLPLAVVGGGMDAGISSRSVPVGARRWTPSSRWRSSILRSCRRRATARRRAGISACRRAPARSSPRSSCSGRWMSVACFPRSACSRPWVVHRTDDAIEPVGQGRYIADAIHRCATTSNFLRPVTTSPGPAIESRRS